jgi:dTDP-4-dehydrorhamnose reductase
MRVLMTGCGGMLGSAVYPAFVRAGHDVVATDLVPRPAPGLPMSLLDVRDYAAVRGTSLQSKPDIILHLAAETDLERCETDRDHAYLTNAIGTHNVALVASELGVPLVYISTAGVFDGTKGDEPYTEFDRPNPINVYGGSKYEGELIVRHTVARHFIVRAGWMVGGRERDHKFVAKVISQLRDGARVLHAVTDKLGTPTYTEDFAQNLLALVSTPYYGLYHMTCEGAGSRLDVARAIVDYYGRSDVEVIPVSSEFFAETYFAPRPRSEMMRNYALHLRGLNLMRPWPDALRAYLDQAAFTLEPSAAGGAAVRSEPE